MFDQRGQQTLRPLGTGGGVTKVGAPVEASTPDTDLVRNRVAPGQCTDFRQPDEADIDFETSPVRENLRPRIPLEPLRSPGTGSIPTLIEGGGSPARRVTFDDERLGNSRGL